MGGLGRGTNNQLILADFPAYLFTIAGYPARPTSIPLVHESNPGSWVFAPTRAYLWLQAVSRRKRAVRT